MGITIRQPGIIKHRNLPSIAVQRNAEYPTSLEISEIVGLYRMASTEMDQLVVSKDVICVVLCEGPKRYNHIWSRTGTKPILTRVEQ